MFVQVMDGQVKDPTKMQALKDRWIEELRPGATGFLGSTGGIDDNGRAIMFARFESAAAARANSERPEQGAWWAEMETCYDGEVTFADSEDVELPLGGGTNEAGFVQVMKVDDVDRDAAKRIDEAFESVAADVRPDVIGGLRVWIGPRSAYDITYFTSEAEARKAESKGMPDDVADVMGDFQKILASAEFIDLSDPWLF